MGYKPIKVDCCCRGFVGVSGRPVPQGAWGSVPRSVLLPQLGFPRARASRPGGDLCSRKCEVFFCRTLLRVFFPRRRAACVLVCVGWKAEVLCVCSVPPLSNSDCMEITTYSEESERKYSSCLCFTSCLCLVLPCPLVQG